MTTITYNTTLSKISRNKYDENTLYLYDESNNKIGYFCFIVNKINKDLYIEDVFVHEEFRGKGFGDVLYFEFSKIYRGDYNNYPIGRYFMNPIAEYIAKKQITNGNLPKDSWNEDNIKRDLIEYGKDIELLDKLGLEEFYIW